MKYFYSILSNPYVVGSKPPFLPQSINLFIYRTLQALGEKRVRKIRSLMDRYIEFMGFRWVFSITPDHYFENFEYIEFYGMKLRAPHPVEKYLEYRYGKDWRVPKKNWSVVKDDGAFQHLKKP